MKPDSPAGKNAGLGPKTAAPGILLEGLCFAYPGGAPVVENLDLALDAERWTVLLGPSGCGKSTLLRLISGSLPSGKGTLRFEPSAGVSFPCAWMAQKDLLLPWLTAEENVLLGYRLRGEEDEGRRGKARELLKAAGLERWGRSLPDALSGGMRQRVALLRTLMEERSLILMDEPFSALDALTRLRLQDLAAAMVSKATVVLVTHDPLEALRLAHRILVLDGTPVRVREVLDPPGRPPRSVDRPEVAALHARLLLRLIPEDRRP
jgi:putative hydroxymethylpyrimidine transport system ATP-binding protein